MLGGEECCKIERWNAAGSQLLDYFLFTIREEEDIRVNFMREYDCPDKVMDDGTIKRFWRGYRVYIELDFRFDDWVTTQSNQGRTCQEFLQDLHNHTGKIKITPHVDESTIAYWVLLENDWVFPYAFARWRGWQGTLIFKGEKIIDISLETPV
jgi:hypothetical protein